MIFYLVPAAAGRPATLQPTQADANREARERGLKVRAPEMQHDVPTDKAGLMGYINAMFAAGEQAVERAPTQADQIEAAADRFEQDAAKDHKPAYTQEQVDAMFQPRSKEAPLDRDAVCTAIADMDGTDLGMVALEVTARIKSLAARLEK
jgi:hypothetical protein